MPKLNGQPWIYSPVADSIGILAPPFVAVLAALALSQKFGPQASVGAIAWFILVVGIDVAHVYGTMFRTYLDKEKRRDHGAFLIFIPILCWAVGAILYATHPLLFWSTLAYVAVFHFVRQQYGFVMIYSRQEKHLPKFCTRIDKVVIYTATIYPLIYWHTHLPREFSWFVEGDFVTLPAGSALKFIQVTALYFYVGVLFLYVLKEAFLFMRGQQLNIARNLLILGTVCSWSVGILFFNGDLIFTLTNVVSHGIPYMTLIWMYERKSERRRRLFTVSRLPFYIGLLVLLAYVEEGFWDAFVWQDHLQFFAFFSFLPAVTDSTLLAILVPLLALPQATHYVFDGFLWRRHGAHQEWKTVLFHPHPAGTEGVIS
jgi:hypothetical protein